MVRAKKFIATALLACVALGAHAKSFSLDLRKPRQGGSRPRLAASASSRDEGTLRSFDLDAGAADVGAVEVGDELSFTLFDDVTITLVLKERMPSPLGGDVFIAEAGGYEGVKTAVVIRTSDGLTVDVQDFRNGKYYKVYSMPDGVKVQEVAARTGKCGCDVLAQRTMDVQLPAAVRTVTPRLSNSSGQVNTYVDILVAYDGKAAIWANAEGGGITNYAQAAVQKMNVAIANTGLDSSFRFRLAGVMQVATAFANYEDSLNAAIFGYGDWNSISANRNKVGADIVAVFVDVDSKNGVSGLAQILQYEPDSEYFSELAYCVCSVRFVKDSHTLTHEIGHTMGCGHSDIQPTSPGPQLYTDSAGYFFSVGDTRYHTIMAYDIEGAGGTEGLGVEEVPYFSSPVHTYLDVAVGDEKHNNTRTLLKTFAIASAWRDPTGEEIGAGDDVCPIEWVTSRSTALSLAKASGKNIFLLAGRDADDDSDTPATRKACEALNKHLRANYICWYDAATGNRLGESKRYFEGQDVGNTFPLIAVIDAASDKTLTAEGGLHPARALSLMLGRVWNGIAFSPMAGTSFDDSIQVSVVANLGETVYYTLDGTTPDADSFRYESPITLTSTATIRARALLPDGKWSLPVEAKYVKLRTARANGYEWTAHVVGTDCIVKSAKPTPTGDVAIPSEIDGFAVREIGDELFRDNTGITSVFIPETVTSLNGQSFLGCRNLAAVNVDAANGIYMSAHGVVYDKAGTTLVHCPAGVKRLDIPRRVSVIADFACKGLWNVKEMVIPPNVERIGYDAFANGNALSSVVFADGVLKIGWDAFSYCGSLAHAWLPRRLQDSEVEYEAFYREAGSVNMHYYASGDLRLFTVHFDVNGGEMDGEADRWVAVSNGQGMTAIGDLPVARREKFKFLGWFTEKNGGTPVASSVKPTESVTYYAQWEYDGSATVAVRVAGDCEALGKVTGGNAMFKAGAKVPLKATANKGAAFEGWFINGVLVSDAASFSYVAEGMEAVELVARFVAMADDHLSVTASDKAFQTGVPVSLALADCFAVDSVSAVTSLSISGLPTGVKYDASAHRFTGTTPAKAGLFYVTCTAKNGNGYQYVATAVWNVGGASTGDGDDGLIGTTSLAQLTGLMTGQPCMFGGFSAATAVTGLPAGLVFDKVAGVISGVPTKPGKVVISFTGANKKKSQRTVIVADGGMHALALNVGSYSRASASAAGVVSGGGVYAAGKSVTIKATPAKGSVFAGWFDVDGAPLAGSVDFRSASFPYVMGVGDAALTARFATAEEDSSIEVGVEDSYETAKNGSFRLAVPVTSISVPALKVSRLPTGLKFDAKALAITGVATKPGIYAVKVSATNASIKKGIERTFTIKVPNLLPEVFAGAGLADSYPCVAGAAPDLSSVLAIMVRDGWKLALSGLPAGLKYDAKSNAITGVATKEGDFTVTFTGTRGKEKEIATATFVVRFPELTLSPVAYRDTDAVNKAAVSGDGKCPLGKKVTLKATPSKGNVFLGWRRVGDSGYLSQAASFSYVTTSEDVTFEAVFATAGEDADNIALCVNDMQMSSSERATINLPCGVAVNWPVVPTALSATTVKVSGLPAGMKFTDKGLLKKGSKTEYDIPPNTIYGAPTAASKFDARVQKTVPSMVTIAVTTAGKSTRTYVLDVFVDALPAWMVGTFDGAGFIKTALPCGLVSLTVASSGKVSGKVLDTDGTWTLSADALDSFDAATGRYVAKVISKNGKMLATNVLECAAEFFGEAARGVTTLYEDDEGRATVWQNLWKTELWKTGAKPFANKKLTVPVNATEGAFTSGSIELKFDASGTVTAAGKFVTGKDATGKDIVYSASCSSVLIPDLEGGNGTDSLPTAYYSLYLYFPRKEGKFNGYSALVQLKWDGMGFEADWRNGNGMPRD